jgi:hypothetical protein
MAARYTNTVCSSLIKLFFQFAVSKRKGASCVLFCGEKFAKHSGVTVIWMSICLLERVGRDERRKEKETF